jgi:outer membrane protein
VNYTTFFSSKAEGAIAGTNLDLSDSWGLAAHLGVDFKVGEKGAIRIDYRKIDIDTKVKLNGANLGTKNTVNIDPSVYGIAYVFSF